MTENMSLDGRLSTSCYDPLISSFAKMSPLHRPFTWTLLKYWASGLFGENWDWTLLT